MRRFALLPLLALTCCAPHRDLEVYGSVPEFKLTSHDGKTFDSASLRGHVWIADFIFTNCPGPCLRMSSQMHRVQKETASMPDIRMVSFSVDPARDTPAALTAFAKRYDADFSRWTFLTGNPGTLQMLSRNAFKLGDVDGSLNHSTRFVLVDQQGRIRGYYGTVEGDPVKQVAADARQLRKENS